MGILDKNVRNMSNPSDNATFARTIKLLVANLDKTKERIQERFHQVDERLDEIEKINYISPTKCSSEGR